MAVMFPLRPGLAVTVKRTKLIIFFIWLSFFAFRFPMLFAANLNKKQLCYVQLDETFGQGTVKLYYFLNLICFVALPFLAILILYSVILVRLKRRKPSKTEDIVLRNG